MRILTTIIRTLMVDVLSRQAEGSNGDVIGPERWTRKTGPFVKVAPT